MVLVGVLTSCEESLVNSSDYDFKYDASKAPVATTGTTVKVSATYAIISGTAVSQDTLYDKGIMIADNAEFNYPMIFPANDNNYQVRAEGLNPLTKYYYRSYASNLPGGGTVGVTKEFTTKEGFVAFNISSTLNTVPEWQAIPFYKIDKDGDGKNWGLAYYNTDKTQACFQSYSWSNAPLKPENYLCLPAIIINGVDAALTVSTEAGDADYFAEKFKLVASVDSITSDNCRDAQVLGIFTIPSSSEYVVTGDIPSSFEGKKVYLGIAHYDCTDNYKIMLTGLKVSYAK